MNSMINDKDAMEKALGVVMNKDSKYMLVSAEGENFNIICSNMDNELIAKFAPLAVYNAVLTMAMMRNCKGINSENFYAGIASIIDMTENIVENQTGHKLSVNEKAMFIKTYGEMLLHERK